MLKGKMAYGIYLISACGNLWVEAIAFFVINSVA